jgi:hypothetical protein
MAKKKYEKKEKAVENAVKASLKKEEKNLDKGIKVEAKKAKAKKLAKISAAKKAAAAAAILKKKEKVVRSQKSKASYKKMTAYLKSVDTGMKVEMAKQAAKDKNARIARQKLLKKHKAVLKKALNKEIAKLNARMKIWQGKLNKEAIAYEQKQKIRAVKLKNHKKKEESKKLKIQYQKQQKKEALKETKSVAHKPKYFFWH